MWPAVGSLQGSPQPRRGLQHGAAQGHGPNCSWDALYYAKPGTIPTLHKNSELQLPVNPQMLIDQRYEVWLESPVREGYSACSGGAVRQLHALTSTAHMGTLHSCTCSSLVQILA